MQVQYNKNTFERRPEDLRFFGCDLVVPGAVRMSVVWEDGRTGGRRSDVPSSTIPFKNVREE